MDQALREEKRCPSIVGRGLSVLRGEELLALHFPLKSSGLCLHRVRGLR